MDDFKKYFKIIFLGEFDPFGASLTTTPKMADQIYLC
jgi:hypothetical protein